MKKQTFSMSEVIAALILVVILGSAIGTALTAARNARIRMTQEARAILVLENAVVQLPTRKVWSEAELGSLLVEELGQVSMPRSEGIRTNVQLEDNQIRLAIVNRHQHQLAVITLPREVAP